MGQRFLKCSLRNSFCARELSGYQQAQMENCPMVLHHPAEGGGASFLARVARILRVDQIADEI